MDRQAIVTQNCLGNVSYYSMRREVSDSAELLRRLDRQFGCVNRAKAEINVEKNNILLLEWDGVEK